MRKSEAYPVLFLTFVVLVAVVVLTLTNSITRDKIALAKKQAVAEMLSALFPNMDSFTYDDKTGTYTILADKTTIGYAFTAEGRGYGGPIDILIGLKPDNKTLQGIRIISQQETPGLGAKIVEASFLDQFSGVSVDQVKLARNGGKIDAITGATISSTAVVKGVRNAIEQRLGKGGTG
ncbi:MAG: hypothetical protein DRN33_04695 [Thermoplasmata archaeon]|nr:MAG: hypothetical protein DRN33_04695 [Thermoplasmata archaeon]